MTTPDVVNHPPHYGGHPSGVECITVVRLMAFDMGNAVKYIWRFPRKNGAEDLQKAQWYLRDILATRQCSFPPHKARYLLREVAQQDTHSERALLLANIASGDIQRAIDNIDAILAAGTAEGMRHH